MKATTMEWNKKKQREKKQSVQKQNINCFILCMLCSMMWDGFLIRVFTDAFCNAVRYNKILWIFEIFSSHSLHICWINIRLLLRSFKGQQHHTHFYQKTFQIQIIIEIEKCLWEMEIKSNMKCRRNERKEIIFFFWKYENKNIYKMIWHRTQCLAITAIEHAYKKKEGDKMWRAANNTSNKNNNSNHIECH